MVDSRHLLNVVRAEGRTASLETVVLPVGLLLVSRLVDLQPNGATDPVPLRALRSSWSFVRNASLSDVPDALDQIWAHISDSFVTSERREHWPLKALFVQPAERTFSTMVAWVEALGLETSGARRDASEAFSQLIRATLETDKSSGAYNTPTAMARLMVALVAPRPNETVYDPCFGTGEGLLEAADAMFQQAPDTTAGVPEYRISVFGLERNPTLYVLGLVRLLVAGVRPALELGDALAYGATNETLFRSLAVHSLGGRALVPGFDCVLADPPWGAKADPELRSAFPVPVVSGEGLFIQHAVRSLRRGGRAVIAVPPALLSRGGTEYDLRRWLLEECAVELVIKLPAKTLRYTSIAPHLLVVRRSVPQKDVRFVELSSLPETPRASRDLASELLNAERAGTHNIASVSVAEILKADARLVLPEIRDASIVERLRALEAFVEFRKLRDVTSTIGGVATRRDSLVDEPEPGTVPLVRTSDVGESVLRIGSRYLRSTTPTRDEQWVRRGDVLLSVKGTIGRVLFVQRTQPVKPPSSRTPSSRSEHSAQNQPEYESEATTSPAPDDHASRLAVANNGLVILRSHDSINPQFLAALLNSDLLQQQMRAAARGVIAHLPLTTLRALQVPVPPLHVQMKVLRRLMDRPGDAVDALFATLSGRDEDPLATFFRENSAISLLTSEAIPEGEELYQRGLDAFRALRSFRNEAAHMTIDLEPHALRWLLTLGAAPVVASRRRGEVPDFESLDATRTMLDRGMEFTRDMTGWAARPAARLTERLLLWVAAALVKFAGEFKLVVDGRVEFVDDNTIAIITIAFAGRAPLNEFSGRLDIAENTVAVDELESGQTITLRAAIHERVDWKRTQDSMVTGCRLLWSARRVDGEVVEGDVSLVLRRPVAAEHAAAAAKDLGPSPYITGGVVENPEMFVGRQSLIEDIKTHLDGATKVILLEGNRRTGKTSILRQLQRPELGLLDRWVPVEISFQGTVGHPTKDAIPTEGVFRLIVNKIGMACLRAGVPVALPNMDEVETDKRSPFRFAEALNGFFAGIDPYECLQIYVDMVTDSIAPRRLLLMFDEFDKLQSGIDNGVTSPQVPENLRNLLQTRSRVAAIITGSRRLKRLREEYWSALFGFGHTIGVDPLEPEEVRQLVTRPVEGRLVFDDAAVRLVAELTARQPYLVQSLCARVFELAKHQGWARIGREELLEAVARMVKLNEHFQALWDNGATDRRRYLMCICSELQDSGQRVNASLLNEHLAERGIVIPIGDVDDDLRFLAELELVSLTNTSVGPQYALTIPLMRRWMTVNIDAEAQRRRAREEWLGTTGPRQTTLSSNELKPTALSTTLCDICGAPMAFEKGASSGLICRQCTRMPEEGPQSASQEVVHDTERGSTKEDNTKEKP